MLAQLSSRVTASVGSGAKRPLRVLTLTTLFPNALQPRHGIFVANRLRRICDTGRVVCDVIAAIPRFPFAYRALTDVPCNESLHGFAVAHPRFPNIPGIGMRVQPDLLAMALLGEVKKCRDTCGTYDIVDSHYFYPDGVAAARVATALRLPLVISARGSDINLIGNIPFARRRMQCAARRAQALIAVSRALADRMKAIDLGGKGVHVLRNGVDMVLFRPESTRPSRERLGIEQSCKWVLGVGNLVPEKGFDLLVDVVAALPEVRLLLVGSGPMRNELERRAASVAPGRVVFRDNMPQSELRFAYSAVDVLALPSLREGWPNVLLEAIACGTPVVAAAVGGVPEILGRDGPGRVVFSREVPNWADAILSTISEPNGKEARRAYAARFGWDEVVSAQIDLYESVVCDWRQASVSNVGAPGARNA